MVLIDGPCLNRPSSRIRSPAPSAPHPKAKCEGFGALPWSAKNGARTRYFGGNFLNILSTDFCSAFSSLLTFSESVLLEVLRQISCLVLLSYISKMREPTLYSLTVAVSSPNPLHRHPPSPLW